MQFSKSIPEEVLSNPNTSKFVSLLDALQENKQEVIAIAMRANNPILCNDKRWLIRYLADCGLMDVPECLPLICLQQLALNVDTIFRMRGSLVGLKLLCEASVLGKATINTSNFVKVFDFLLPNSKHDGILTDSTDTSLHRFLVDRWPVNAARSITITLQSKAYSTMTAKERSAFVAWLKRQIDGFLSFHPNCTINLTFTNYSAYVYPQDFNNYFKNI